MRRLLRLSVLTVAGIVLGLTLYAGLVHIGLARSLFAPTLRGDIALARSDRPGMRVLFVGNRFTFKNSLPALVRDLAAGDPGATPIFSVEYAAGGWSLHQANKDDGLDKLLQEVHWDVVVLQEKSWVLSLPEDQWRRETYPAARDLHEKISAVGARTVLFMTWGYVRGDRWHERHDTYAAMQGRLDSGYSKLGAELGAQVAPPGSRGRRRYAASRASISGPVTASIPAGSVPIWLLACSTPWCPDASRLGAGSQRASRSSRPTRSSRSPKTCSAFAATNLLARPTNTNTGW